MSGSSRAIVLGYLVVRATTDGGLRGGYLLLTEFGRPVEFHYTSALRVSRQQRLLYGKDFERHHLIDALAKPLTDRQGTAPRAVVVDQAELLELRTRVPAPVLCLGSSTALTSGPGLLTHPNYGQDAAAFERLADLVASGFDWLEPFERLDAALGEIRDASLAA